MRHHDLVRGQLVRFRGKEVDAVGDGFFASFDGRHGRSPGDWRLFAVSALDGSNQMQTTATGSTALQ